MVLNTLSEKVSVHILLFGLFQLPTEYGIDFQLSEKVSVHILHYLTKKDIKQKHSVVWYGIVNMSSNY